MTTWPFDPQLQAFGATFTPATVAPGTEYWKLISAEGPVDIGGNVNIYVDVRDRAGQRMVGVPVQYYWSGGDHIARTEAKPDDPNQGASMPMSSGGNAYGARIADGKPSDSIFGMGMAHFEKHQSFRLVFQLATATTGEPPSLPPIPQPTEPTDLYLPSVKATQLRDAIEQAQRLLTLAKGML